MPVWGIGMSSFNQDQRDYLLETARTGLQHFLETGRVPNPNRQDQRFSIDLEQVRNLFVTLKIQGRLRGCIGTFDCDKPLCEAVIDYAIQAAHDDRFSPVTASELDTITFEISVLTEPRPIQSHHEIELGNHGIILQKHGRSAVFLPIVPVELNWDLPTTLSHLSDKAGLRPLDWQQNCTFWVFEDEHFEESH